MFQESFFYRLFSGLLRKITMYAQQSATLGLGRAFFLLLTRWLAGSFLFRTFWKKDSLSLWHGSLTFALLRSLTAHLKAFFARLFPVLRASLCRSISGRLGGSLAAALQISFLRAALDFLLAFTAVGLLFRLAFRSFSGITLLILAGGFLLFFLLRLRVDELETALRASSTYRLLKWLLRPGF